MIRYYGYALLLLLSLAACKKGDKVPSYIEIQEVEVAPFGGTEVTSKISDVWVYANEKLLGVWELPARIPVLADGNTLIEITPGVKRNGSFDDRSRYPFFTRWSQTVPLVKEQTLQLTPAISYLPNTDIWVEAFEDAGTQLIVSDHSDTTLLFFTSASNPDIVMEDTGGNAAGGFAMDQERPYVHARTEQNFAASGGAMFLELDYSTNVLLTVGVSFDTDGQFVAEPYVYLTPTTSDGTVPEWNKVYIDLSPVFNLALSQRNFYFEAWAPSVGTARIYLDNIKLVRLSQ